MITLGNQSMTGMSDWISMLCKDSRITAIGLHIEALDDLARFADAITIAHQHSMPVVVLKAGRSEKGAAITLTHTASLTSNDSVMNALFERLGVARVDTVSRFLETLKLLHVLGPLPDTDLVSLSCSGGEASMISDAAGAYDINFRDFSDADTDRIRPTVHELVNISNPFDYHTFDWARPERLEATYTAVMNSGFTLNILVMDFPRSDRCVLADWMVSLSAWQAAAVKTGCRSAILATLPECLPEDISETLVADGIVPLSGIEDALAAVKAAACIDFSRTCYIPWQTEVSPSSQHIVLDENHSKRLLADYEIRVPESRLCLSHLEALDFAHQAGYPLVAKAIGTGFEHKTELGAVRLNLASDPELEQAVVDLSSLSGTVLVEKMISNNKLELIVGVNFDPVAGPYLLVGAGGVLAELIEDSRILLFPYNREQIQHELGQLKISALMSGFRGEPAICTTELEDTILKVQDFVLAYKDTLLEMDINPLIITGNGRVYVADALLKLAGNQKPD